MNVLGIYTYETFFSDKILKAPLFSYQDISIGFTAILTEIQKEEHNLKTLICSQYTNIDETLKEYNIKKYDLICFTAVTSQIKIVYEIAKKIKSINSNIKIVIGGSYATLATEEVIKCNFFDAVCIGEGIKTIKLYLKYLNDKISAEKVDGFWIREKNKIIKNKKSIFSDFSKFPIINSSMWDKWIEDKSMHSILISRGCINNCSYCSNHRLKKQNEGKYLSYRKIKDIICELNLLTQKYKNLKYVHLESESFSINLPFAYKLFHELGKFSKKSNNKISFSLNLHLNDAVQKDIQNFVTALKAANVELVCIGLESGSYRIRKKVLNRPKYTNIEFINFCQYLIEHNIFLNVYVLLGLPTETENNLKQTISVLKKIKPQRTTHSIFYPYPKTDIYDIMTKKGIIKEGEIVNGFCERRVARLNYPKLPLQTIQKYYEYLHKATKEKRFMFVSKMLQKNI